MLVVYYCNGKDCRHIHIRTDEREKDDHGYCPRCGAKMRFICDFITWTCSDATGRKKLIKDSLIISYRYGMDTAGKRVIHISQIGNIEIYYEMKKLRSQQNKLKSENERLKTMAEDYKDSYSMWKERGIVYHDELWRILSYYEPEKYSRDCPK